MLRFPNPSARRPWARGTFLTLWLVTAFAFAPAFADDLAVLPTVGVLWVDGSAPATAELFLAPGMANVPEVLGLRSTNPDVEVVDFSLHPDSAQLLVRLRLTHGRATDLDAVVVEYRSLPPKEMLLGAIRILPASAGNRDLGWARASTAADIGMVFAGALLNAGAEPVRVRSLTYAPDAVGQGLVLTRLGKLEDFEAWSDRVMGATATARWPSLDAGQARLFAPSERARTPPPPAPLASTAADYRVALSDALPDSRWGDASRLDLEVAPGEALFVAITIASFRYDIGGLALAITPVATVETRVGCCLRVGAGLAAVTRGDLPF